MPSLRLPFFDNIRPRALLLLVMVAVAPLLPACASAPTKGPTGGHLVESEVTADALERIFRQAFLETQAINAQAVRVNLDGIGYQVLAEPKRKLLVYLTHFRFRPSVDAKERLAFVNTLNSRYIYTRFSVDKDGDLACEYFLSFKGGIDENQVVDALQWMTNTTVQSIKQADTKNFVQ